MKGLKANKITKKIICIIIVLMLCNFIIPNITFAKSNGDSGTIFPIICRFATFLCDSVMEFLQHTLVTMDDIKQEDGTYNFQYAPAVIFSGKVPAFDINFIEPGKGNTSTISAGTTTTEKDYESIASELQPTIATWYNAFRRVALVGLLSVLLYIGVQIVIKSASEKENSKYKKMLTDWLVALCLLFTLHYIMSATITVTNKISTLFTNGETDTLLNTLRNEIVGVDDTKTWEELVSQVIMYVLMVIYTITFTFQYLKRVLYMAFFTMIAPLVALTYPLDKIKDGKAQAFTMWMKEYVFNALIQVVHLVLYFTLVGSALSLVEIYPLYGIIVIGFMTQGEKIIRKMFGFNNATTLGAFEAAATGGLIAAGVKKLGSLAKPKGKGTSTDKPNNNIRTASNNSGAGAAGGIDALTQKYGAAAGKSIVKTGVKAGFAAQGALWGLASGISQGDVGAAFKGAAAGGAAGGALGNRVVQEVDISRIQQSADNFKDVWNTGAYGEQFAKDASEARTFKRTGDYKELKEKYGDNLTDDKLRAMMQAGITDKKNMDKVLSSGNMNDAIGYYTLAKKCPDEIYYDDEKLKNYLEDLGLSQTDAETMRKNMKAFR